MRHIIIGTAGHVDHGKSALIRALTGIELDRLREEQERGMSIELGFAHFGLPGGVLAGIVDVPGHQRFIKNMLMGATGMDAVILVVAADEGVMPQTREHFDILRLLNVKVGLLALTKIDLVDPEWLDLVRAEISDLVHGSFLEGAPVIGVSSVTREGLPELVKALALIGSQVPERPAAGPFRMAIDRVFSIAGFGVVVTGTLAAGVVRVGDQAEILPHGALTRVRGIQVHGGKESLASAGTRVALNLAGIEVSEASRGEVITAAGSLAPTQMVDVRLELLPELPAAVAHRSRIRFHAGAVELMGRIAFLDRLEARAGESVLAQIRLEAPTAIGRGDRFVLRHYSPSLLVGGGAVLDIHPHRHRRNQPGVIDSLLVLERGSPEELLSHLLLNAGPTLVSMVDLAAASGLAPETAGAALQALAARGVAVSIGKGWAHGDQLRETQRRLLERLDEFHRMHPLLPGIAREDLRGRLGRMLDSRFYSACLACLEASGAIVNAGPLVHAAQHQVRLEGEDSRCAAGILNAYRVGGLNPPSVDEALSAWRSAAHAREILDVLVFRGDLVKIAEGLLLSKEAVESAAQTAVEQIRENGRTTVGRMRDSLESSRKVMVPLMEYFDATHLTRRKGDERVLY